MQPAPPPPPSQVSLAAELVAKSVLSEIKIEIAKLAGTTQDQLKLDEDKLNLEEVNTYYIRLGMKEEANASMAALHAVKKRLAVGEVSLTATTTPSHHSSNQRSEEESNKKTDDGSANLLLQEKEKLCSGATANE